MFYESVHRILKTLSELNKMLHASRFMPHVVVCRELTKKFESIYRGSADEIIEILESNKNNLKGEFVVIINKVKHRLSQNKV